MIEIVRDKMLARECDNLLTKLIIDEKKYNNLINENYKVVNYFENIIEKEDNILLCYKEDDKAVGYLYLKPTNDDILSGYLYDGLYVLEEYRQKGIAKELLSYAKELLDKKDISFIDVNVMADNIIAKKLYEDYGFNDSRITMRKNI